jgi:hypothetical protein
MLCFPVSIIKTFYGVSRNWQIHVELWHHSEQKLFFCTGFMQTEPPPGCRRRGHDEAAASAAGSWGHSLGPSFLVVYVWLVGFFSAELYADK